jgi:hypothetical protein
MYTLLRQNNESSTPKKKEGCWKEALEDVARKKRKRTSAFLSHSEGF